METSPDSGHGNAPAQAGTEGVASEILVICGWCPELHILRRPARTVECALKVLIDHKKKVHAGIIDMAGPNIGKYTDLRISHGICDACKASHFPETVKVPA